MMFLAIDGGNSKTEAVLGTDDGKILAFVRGPGSSPHDLGVPATIALLDRLVATARDTAGLCETAVVDRADVYLAGADLPAEVAVLDKAVTAAGWARTHHVDNDTFALLRAGTANPDAVAIVCGAGINCVGRRADGRTARFPALGQISGDWGGGHHLAALALYHAARGEDGRGPATALSSAVAAHCGQSTVEGVSIGIHLGHISRARVDELSEVLFAVAAAGDPVARRIVARQADEIVGLAAVAAGRLGLGDSAHAVVLGGGVLRAGHTLLDEQIRAGILARTPLAGITVVTRPPVVGACLTALYALGAPSRAAAAISDALDSAIPTRMPQPPIPQPIPPPI